LDEELLEENPKQMDEDEDGSEIENSNLVNL
jgi:hypothetical protein